MLTCVPDDYIFCQLDCLLQSNQQNMNRVAQLYQMLKWSDPVVTKLSRVTQLKFCLKFIGPHVFYSAQFISPTFFITFSVFVNVLTILPSVDSLIGEDSPWTTIFFHTLCCTLSFRLSFLYINLPNYLNWCSHFRFYTYWID